MTFNDLLGHEYDDFTCDPYADLKVCDCGERKPAEDIMCARCVEHERQLELMDEMEEKKSQVMRADPSIMEIAMGDERGGYFLRGKKVETNIYPTLTDCYESAYTKLVKEVA